MPTQGFLKVEVLDYDNEWGTANFRVPELTSANFATVQPLIAALVSATVDLMAVTGVNYEFGNLHTDANPVALTDPVSQRETQWSVISKAATTGKTVTVSIPTADLNHLDPNKRNHAEVGDAGDVDAFLAAFEDLVTDEWGNALTINRIVHKGHDDKTR